MDYAELLKRIKLTPRVNGYTSPFTETKMSAIHGLGLFAVEGIAKGVVVAAWGGHIVTGKEITALPEHISNHYALEIYPDVYLAEISKDELDASDFINHSCEPNCTIANALVMVTARPIEQGEELTADFSSKGVTQEKAVCTCGTKSCKKVIFF